MPELPELTVVQEVLTRRIVGQTIVSAEFIPPGGPIVVRDLTGEGFAAALTEATFTRSCISAAARTSAMWTRRKWGKCS